MNAIETYIDRLKSRGHRNYIGGEDVESWYGIGRLQYHYLVSKGLKSNHVFLDVACGSMRLGQYLIPMLGKGNYFGLDGNMELIEQGVENEIFFDLTNEKKPSFSSNYDFDFSFMGDVKFDYAIAQSLFTHLTIEDIDLCFKNIKSVMNSGSKFYFTFFEGPSENNPKSESDPHKGWFYSVDDLRKLTDNLDLNLSYIGNWDHPRNQKLALITLNG